MPHGPKSDLAPADLKLAADAFEAALARLDEEPVDVSLHLLRRRLASHVMALVFSGENDLEVVVEQALTRLYGTEQQRGKDVTAPAHGLSRFPIADIDVWSALTPPGDVS